MARVNSRRMFLSTVIALAIHGIVFFVAQYGIRIQPEELPEYSGPMIVTIQPLPGPTSVRRRDVIIEALGTEEGSRLVLSPESGSREIEDERTMPEVREEEYRIEKLKKSVEDEGMKEDIREVTAEEQKPQLEKRGAEDAVTGEESFETGEEPQADEFVFPTSVEDKEPPLALDFERLDEALEKSMDSSELEKVFHEEQTDESVWEEEMPFIIWDDVSGQRTLLSSGGLPVIPEWVKEEGLDLKVEISFTVTSEGHTISLKVGVSSGYSDVDTAVLEAVRKFRFNPIQEEKEVRGRVSYVISTK